MAAFSATKQYWKKMVQNKRSFGSGGTSSSSRLGAESMEQCDHGRPAYNKFSLRGEFAPVYVVMGFVGIAVAIGLHTAKQQLVHSPGVNISKKRRESLPEVDIPHVLTSNGDQFINKSFLRKVAHIQLHNNHK